MKKILERLNINNINNSLYFLQKILKILYILLLLVIVYFAILICKEWKIYKVFLDIFSILSPLFLGIIISYILNPIIKKLSLKMKRSISVSIVYTSIVALLAFLCCYLYPKFVNQINDLIKDFPDILNSFNKFINNIFHNNIKIDIAEILSDYAKNNIFSKLSNILITVKNIIKIIGVFILGLMISFYLSLDFDETIRKIFYKLPIKNKEKYKCLLKEIDEKVFSYVKGTFLIALIVLIVSCICFEFVNLKGSIFFGLYNAVTNIIPYVGPYIGAVPIIIVAFTASNKLGFSVLIILIVIQAVESYVLHPLIMSKSMSLHPVTILISLLIFGYFFGIIGMVVAMPIVSIIKTVLIYFYK